MYLKQKDPPFFKMTKLLRGYGYSGAKLAELLGVSKPTGSKRLTDPQTLTLGDLDRINRFGHIPIEEIREAIVR